jgi:hypothetical protein
MSEVIKSRTEVEKSIWSTPGNVNADEDKKEEAEQKKAEQAKAIREFGERKNFIREILPYCRYNINKIQNLEKDIKEFIEKYKYLEKYFIINYKCSKTELNDDDVKKKINELEKLIIELSILIDSFNNFIMPNMNYIKQKDIIPHTITQIISLLANIINLTEILKSEAEKYSLNIISVAELESLKETLKELESELHEKERNVSGGKKSKKQPKKEILGAMRCIYKLPGDRKEYVKHKGKLITIKDFKEFMKPKKQAKPKKQTKPKKQAKAKKQTKTK